MTGRYIIVQLILYYTEQQRFYLFKSNVQFILMHSTMKAEEFSPFIYFILLFCVSVYVVACVCCRVCVCGGLRGHLASFGSLPPPREKSNSGQIAFINLAILLIHKEFT